MLEQLTIFLAPDSDAGKTQYGENMTNLEWCEKEVDRINNGGGKAYLRTDPNGNVAVYVDAKSVKRPPISHVAPHTPLTDRERIHEELREYWQALR